MDIFAHGLWAGAAAKVARNKKPSLNLNFWKVVWWGVFPDLFAFTIPFIWLFWNLIFGDFNFADFPRPEAGEPPTALNQFFVFRLASSLYNFSHSAIIFLIVFGIILLILRRPVWELLGWFLHILIDIPTHSYRFYPTPFLWPLSGWKFDGFPWGNPWFLIINYAAIVITYYLLRKKNSMQRLSSK